jgi:hypothetical protein
MTVPHKYAEQIKVIRKNCPSQHAQQDAEHQYENAEQSLCFLQLLGLKDGNTLVALQTSDRSSQLDSVSQGQFLVVADPTQLAALEVCSI